MSQQQRLSLATVVVDGPIALHTRRLLAAQRGEVGLQVLRMEQMAARLAGGFLRPASSEDLDVAVRTALAGGRVQRVRKPFKFSRCNTRCLTHPSANMGGWRVPPGLGSLQPSGRRPVALGTAGPCWTACRILVPTGPCPCREATGRIGRQVARSSSSLPPCRMSRRSGSDSVSVLAEHTRVFWSGPAPPGSEKLPGERVAACAGFLPAPEVVACADARSEALEALRWVRELISSGRAMPRDIALAAADPKPWDAALLAARAEACLPLHFSHGIPALETRGGQACASLANLLQHGLSAAARPASAGALRIGCTRVQ